MAAQPQPPFTVTQAMERCNVPITQYGGQTTAERIAEEVFENSFESCLLKNSPTIFSFSILEISGQI